ncbi:hypothetical protein AZA_56441 [Nitrospirillum viridazoti Y2]|uniref:Transglycosylase-like protein with SLT domain n=1 Tax=Nitrospirillum amazonense TaxID=28077 RepID=A0A560II21_9PROT|nr:hypothetical protein [Nitrospirillum amazonense]EGX99987.1 hypothetical protein AZA_56441 [Nitrospirillum amazonense Y2]TWB58698.1 hypothetical protein FBZ92_109191 [Nitrospirillum amazonense]
MTSPDPFFVQLCTRAVRPALGVLALPADGAFGVNITLGTAAKESGGRFLAQWPTGPALGLWQMEPATHDDVWDNFLHYRPDLAARVSSLLVPGRDRTDQLVWNLQYAAAMCRLRYYRVAAPRPDGTDVNALADYWKAHYNTPEGAGKASEFVTAFKAHIGDPFHA